MFIVLFIVMIIFMVIIIVKVHACSTGAQKPQWPDICWSLLSVQVEHQGCSSENSIMMIVVLVILLYDAW